MMRKTFFTKHILSALLLIIIGLLAEPLLMAYSLTMNKEVITIIDVDWNNDTDEKEDNQEKDKINTYSDWVRSKQNKTLFKSNFNFKEKKFYSLNQKVISPPPERNT